MDRFPYDTALAWIPLLPMAAALIHGFAGKRAEKGLVSGLGIGSVFVAFVLSLFCAFRVWGVGAAEPTTLSNQLYTWFSLQGQGGRVIPVDVKLTMDGLSAVMAVMVTGIGTLIHVYSASYMHDDPGFARFFAYLNLFTGSMLLLVLASSLPVLFVGWEGVGVCSYLLIGFWYTTPAYAQAAKKAFIVNRIGDLGVLVAMLLLAYEAGSAELQTINHAAVGMLGSFGVGLDVPAVVIAAFLLFLGCAGKSAQLPLYVWLPDAMAGPTPVSALIHAATMVTAGVYLCARMSPVFLAAPPVMAMIAVVGSLTALLAAVIAVAQKDLKKILAYSTVSQLGFMFGAIGVGAFSAAIFHVFTHAFFKACLFLGAGSVMHAVSAHGDADVTKLGGLRRVLPYTFATFAISTASIAGFPGLAGFFSKDAILAGALALATHGQDASSSMRGAAWFTFVVLALVAVLTAFYMVRCAALTFTGSYRGKDAGYEEKPHESPAMMTGPLMLLAVGAVVAGYLGLGGAHAPWAAMLGESVRDLGHSEAAHEQAHRFAMIIGTIAALVGLGAGWVAFVNHDDDAVAATLPARLFALLRDACRVDALYDRIVVTPLRVTAEFVAAIDRAFLENLVIKAPALTTDLAARGLVRTQDGHVQTYGVAMAVGLVGVLAFFEWPRVVVDVETTSNHAKLHVAGGFGQRVRVDLDSDGTFEHDFSTQTDFEADYGRDDLRGLVLQLKVPPNGVVSELRLTEEPQTLTSAELGTMWRGTEDSVLFPVVRREGARAHVRPNGESLMIRRRANAAGEAEVVLEPGESFLLGRANVRVLGVVRATIEVENVFGNRRRERVDIVLRPDGRAPTPARPVQGGANP